jgi:TM2 domain-containing membrane protein YozV
MENLLYILGVFGLLLFSNLITYHKAKEITTKKIYDSLTNTEEE